MNKLYNFRIRPFLRNISIFLGILSLIYITILWQEFSRINSATEAQLAKAETMRTLQDIRFHVVQIQQFLTDVGATHNADGFEEARQNLQAAKGRISALAEQAPHLSVEIAAIGKKIQLTHDAGVEMAEAYIYDGRESGNLMMLDPDSGLDVRSTQLSESLNDVVSRTMQDMESSALELRNTVNMSRAVGIGFAILFSVLVCASMYLVFLKIIPPLRQLRDSLQDINAGDGDLTQRLPCEGDDLISQVARQFNRFLETVQNIMRNVSEAAEDINLAGSEMKESTARADQSMTSQQSDVEMVATAISQLSSTVRDVAHNAANAASAVSEADTQAALGKQVVGETIQVIDRLSAEIQNSASVIKTLESDCDSVGSVLEVIRGIAEQTNLLALNAAIEAARAGEQGRGFAVVADEVRTLASRTQASTREIQDMLERLQSGSHDAVLAMNNSQERAQSSVESAEKAGASLDSITQMIAHVTDMNLQIASAVEEQGVVAENINENISQISHNSLTTTADVSSISKQSIHLADVAGTLSNTVSRFKI